MTENDEKKTIEELVEENDQIKSTKKNDIILLTTLMTIATGIQKKTR